MSSSLLRQGMTYGLIGTTVLLIDWLVFVTLSAAGVNTVPANLCGRVIGAGLGFWANGSMTFKDIGGSRLGWARMLRFAVIWLAMTALSTFALYGIEHRLALGWAWIAKPFVDGLLAGVGFLASRYWIYK